MEGDLGKKKAFIQVIHPCIQVTLVLWSMNIPSTMRHCVLLLHADSDVTTAKYQTLNGQCVIIDKFCICIQLLINSYHLSVGFK